MMVERPAVVQDMHLRFLDDLRMSGDVNMEGAAPYLASRFGLGRREAMEVNQYWMDSFTERHPNEV
jgi:hypothetical protein